MASTMSNPPTAERSPRVLGLRVRLFGFDVHVPWWSLLGSVSLAGWAFFHVTDGWAGRGPREAGAIAFIAVVCLSLLGHELGHAFAARRLGLAVGRITISCFGGATEIDFGSAGPREQALVSLAGPAVNGLLAADSWFVLHFIGTTAEGARSMVRGMQFFLVVNVIFLVVNLVPVLPFDSGRVVQAVLWRATGRPGWATVLTAGVGVAFALAFIAQRLGGLGRSRSIDLFGVVVDIGTAVVVLVLAAGHLVDGWRHRSDVRHGLVPDPGRGER